MHFLNLFSIHNEYPLSNKTVASVKENWMTMYKSRQEGVISYLTHYFTPSNSTTLWNEVCALYFIQDIQVPDSKLDISWCICFIWLSVAVLGRITFYLSRTRTSLYDRTHHVIVIYKIIVMKVFCFLDEHVTTAIDSDFSII